MDTNVSFKVYSSCQQQKHCCHCSPVSLNLLLPALITVMRMMMKKPKIQTPATGSTTVASMPETKTDHCSIPEGKFVFK